MSLLLMSKVCPNFYNLIGSCMLTGTDFFHYYLYLGLEIWIGSLLSSNFSFIARFLYQEIIFTGLIYRNSMNLWHTKSQKRSIRNLIIKQRINSKEHIWPSFVAKLQIITRHGLHFSMQVVLRLLLHASYKHE